MIIDSRLVQIAASQPYPLLFSTIGGAHMFGFPSSDSDFDLRGVHILPLRDVVGLNDRQDTIEVLGVRDGLDLDLVTYDVGKFFGLLLQRSGNILEQIYSPLVVYTTPEHAELKEIARGCITRHHAHHYLGFSRTQWKLFEKEPEHRVKPLLYVYRVLLTGIYLMQTGQVEANLVHLNQHFNLGPLPDLIARKLAGPEKSILDEADLEFHRAEFDRLTASLEEAMAATHLPDAPTSRAELNSLLVRVRLQHNF
jgi:predicted nucleotidyltransferase